MQAKAYTNRRYTFLHATLFYPAFTDCPRIDIDYTGGNIKVIRNLKSWEACANECADNPKCKFFTWVSVTYTLSASLTHRCYLKDRTNGEKTVKGLISGKSGCVSQGWSH